MLLLPAESLVCVLADVFRLGSKDSCSGEHGLSDLFSKLAASRLPAGEVGTF